MLKSQTLVFSRTSNAMAQTETRIRVRPLKVAVLIPDAASFDDVSLAVRFLSRIWGGRYCPILPVTPSGDDARGRRWLAQARPDFVFGLSVDDALWNRVASESCQHRVYQGLTREYVETLDDPQARQRIKVTTVIPALRTRRLQAAVPGRRPLRFVRAEDAFALAPYVAVVFGDGDPVWGRLTLALPPTEPPIWFNDGHTAADFVRVTSEYITSGHESWLDLGSEGLSPLLESMAAPPTIVAVGSPTDLALAWNLRATVGASTPAWVIPVPIDALSEDSFLDTLQGWMGTVNKFGYTPNFCNVVSLSIPQTSLREIATTLQGRFGIEGIQFVDPISPYEEIPKIQCFEEHKTVTADLTDRALTLAVPRPTLAGHMRRDAVWVVDVLRDERTNRCVAELCLPPRPCVQEILNVPAPPRLPMLGGVPKFGFGADALRVHCTMESEVIRLHLPAADEILEEVLIEARIRPVHDEKRAVYGPALERFSGLSKAAHHFKRRLRQVIRALRGFDLRLMSWGDSSTVPTRGTYLVILGTAADGLLHIRIFDAGGDRITDVEETGLPDAQAGAIAALKRQLPGLLSPHRLTGAEKDQLFAEATAIVGQTLRRCRGTADISAIQREAKLGNGKMPDELSRPGYVHQMLSGLSPAARHVSMKRFTKYWRDYYPDDTRLKTLLELWGRQGWVVQAAGGFTLEPGVREAIDEGLIPVVLAGNFLHGLTQDGFLWVPGVKYRRGAIEADLDIIAVCDGALVFVECKEMEGVPKTASDWEAEIWPKFAELIDAAKLCRADVVVLASLADAYPDGWDERARSEAGDPIGVLLLTREDLDNGYRDLPGTAQFPARPMGIRDVLRNQHTLDLRREPPGPRTVSSPVFVAQYGC